MRPMGFKIFCLFILLVIATASSAFQILDSPFTSTLGIGAALRAENQYTDMQPTLNNAFSVSEGFRWRNIEALLEWTRWSESSGNGVYSVAHRQDLYTLWTRYEVLHDDWLTLFFGAGLGILQDRLEANFGTMSERIHSDLALDYGAEAGVTLHFLKRVEFQLSGRLMSQPHDSRWIQWVNARVAFQIF